MHKLEIVELNMLMLENLLGELLHANLLVELVMHMFEIVELIINTYA